MTPEAEQRLRAHVRSIANAALLPWSAAEDVSEEMLGHLVERVEAAIANGIPEPDAVQAALTDFGGVAAIGTALAETYHSRLWVSTVGVLLTAKEDTATRPGAITGLRLLLAFQFATAAVFGCLALIGATPVRAVVAATLSLASAAAAVIAYRGLGIGQAWAVRFSVAAAAVMVFLGLVEMSSTQAGTTTISISAIAAGIVLVWLWGSSEQVGRFVAGSRSIGRRLGVALTATLLAPVLVAGVYPNLPDPTQAGPSDVDMTLTMACGRRDLQMQDGPLLRDRQFADLTVDMLWRRSDLLPGGLGGLVGGFPAGDTAGFRIIEPATGRLRGRRRHPRLDARGLRALGDRRGNRRSRRLVRLDVAIG